MFNFIFPNAYVDNVFMINYEKIQKLGFKALIFDIDSTLVPHGAETTAEVDQLFKHIHELGLKTLLLSNNSDERIKDFNRNIQTLYIPMANKPNKANYLKAVKMLGVEKSEVLLIGDQMFTDVLGANLCGIQSILVKYLLHEGETKIGKKRRVEQVLLGLYNLNHYYPKRITDIIKEETKPMPKKRKLLSEIHPVFYALAEKKGILKRNIDDARGHKKFSKEKEEALLPNVVSYNASNLIKTGRGIDPVLQENKAYNIDLAASKIDKIVVHPGEEFSFWKLVGKINKQNGYRDGRVIINNKIQAGMGGGLCNLANSIHLLILHSPLTITEFHNHSDALAPDPGKRVPFATGTSISYNYVDYRFKNKTNQDVQLHLWCADKKLHAELRSEEIFPWEYRLVEEDHHFAKEGDKYYRISKIYKETVDKQTSKVLKKELVLDNHSEVLFDYDLIPQDQIRNA
ncbi:YqeG family HAD IIIA-type phosphatase [Staphylococcus simulans]|uniref:YqeG family HAD IIIA-type phosphatase n=1 Tax=Staphylococcus simulans TaxID=1286 RepID=UPI0021D0C2BB|nr:YqeG family HAD IIIA-type phosphatase [Staphylococcus simulans]UXR37981.1 YqeG family HAD IIIA-type phosphatase [Staphylococcus simulans]